MICCNDRRRGSSVDGKGHRRDDGVFSDMHGSRYDLLAEFGDVIFEGAADFSEQTEFAESTDGSGDLGTRPEGQALAELSGGNTADKVLAAHNSQGQVEIGEEEEVDAAVGSASVILNRTANAIQVTSAGRIVLQDREELQIAAIGRGEDFPDRTQAVDGFLDRRMFHFCAAIPVYHLAVVFKERDVVGRRLDSQDMAELVVHLDGGVA